MSGDTHATRLAPKVVVATTVALSFISLWRAAAVILGDLASTMFYVGGIAAQAIGPSAPWVVIAVLLFSFAIRSIYMESCSMFVRGGVYLVVRDALGPVWAKFSVSALVVDYVLTGPISSVSAGHYLAGLINNFGRKFKGANRQRSVRMANQAPLRRGSHDIHPIAFRALATSSSV